MSESENFEKRGHKRKKKRSAAQMLKKIAHSRSQGQGFELESESYRHMVHVMELIRSEFPQMDDKETFADNIIEGTKGHEVDYTRNQVASCVLEALIPFVSFDIMKNLVDAFFPSLRPMCSDRFASHVVQTTITVCCNRILQNDPKHFGTTDEKFGLMGIKLIKYVLNNLEEFIWDSYANHIARTCVECLGGLMEIQGQGKKTKLDLEKRREVPENFTELLTKTSLQIQNWPQFHEFGHEELTSGFLQSLLYSLKNVDLDLCNSIVKTISQKCYTKNSDEDLSNIFEAESSARLLEVCLMVCGEDTFAELFKKFFVKKLRQLSLSKTSNFAVQKLLDFCPKKELFEEIYTEIEEHLEAILLTGHTGVLASLANACLRLRSKQGPFLVTLSKILKCSEPEEKQVMLVLLCATFKNFDQYERVKSSEEKLQLNLHGSLILQAMLKFNKPIKVVNSLMGMNTNELVSLFGDPKGSRILDAFMDSSFVGEKSREKMTRKLKGYWASLACCVHGSRCLDKVWEKSHEKDRTYIMNELAAAGESLRSTKTGKLIYTKFKVNVFMRSKTEWAESFNKEQKTKDLFADILG